MEVRLTGLMILFVVQIETEACTTPSGHTGACSPMAEYADLTDVFANYVKGTEELQDQFLCKDHRRLAGKSYWGLQRTDERRPQTTDISIDEFPWLSALISKDKLNDKEEILCQGSLINDRYIITAAHCTSNRRSSVTRIYLEDFNITNGREYVKVGQYHDEGCSAREEFGVEEIISHYFYSSETGQNGVALIRLNRSVTYSDYIRPSCVTTLEMISIRPGDTLYVTGWGKISTVPKLDVEEKIRNTLIANGECQDTLNEFKDTILLPEIYNMCWHWILKKNFRRSSKNIPLFKYNVSDSMPNIKM